MRLEDLILLTRRQTGVQWHNFRVTQLAFGQRIRGITDFALTVHEDQNIAQTLIAQFINRFENAFQLVAITFIFACKRTIASLHRVSTTGYFNDRCAIEMVRKALWINGCRGNDDFQIRTTRQQLFQVTQNEVDVKAALVRFIDNDGVVLIKKTVMLNLRQQNTVGHQFDLSLVRNLVVKTYLIADKATQLSFHLFRNAVGHRARCQTTRLSMTNQTKFSAPKLGTDFR